AQPLGNPVAYGRVGGSASLRDAILFLGDFQCVLPPGLLCRSQGKGKRSLRLAGCVEVIGQVEDSLWSVCLEIKCSSQMQFPALMTGQTVEQGLAELVVNEDTLVILDFSPDNVSMARLVQTSDGLGRCLLCQFRRSGQVKFFSEHRANR